MNDGLIIPPSATESEQAVIGAVLNNPAVLFDIRLPADAFFNSINRRIWKAILEQSEQGKPIDVITTWQAATSKQDPIELGYLNDIVNSYPASATAPRHAQRVIEQAGRRGLMALGNDIFGDAQTLKPFADVVESIASKLDNLSNTGREREPKHISEGINEWIEGAESRDRGDPGAVRTATGFRDLDERLNGGLAGGQLIVVAARPSMGKSAFALNIAHHYAVAHGVPALMLSQEMTGLENVERVLSAQSRVKLDHLQGVPDQDDWSAIVSAVDKLKASPLWIDDESGLTLTAVQAKARRMKRKNGLGVLVIDYVQLMEGRGDNRNSQIEGITRGLKQLAKDLHIPVVLLSQLNRDLEKRPNKRPMMADLRDSGAIEQDADIVLSIYRDEVYDPDSRDIGTAEIGILKQRGGEAHKTVRLAFVGSVMRFENLSHDYRPPESKKDKAAKNWD